jgi:hypothetical protein
MRNDPNDKCGISWKRMKDECLKWAIDEKLDTEFKCSDGWVNDVLERSERNWVVGAGNVVPPEEEASKAKETPMFFTSNQDQEHRDDLLWEADNAVIYANEVVAQREAEALEAKMKGEMGVEEVIKIDEGIVNARKELWIAKNLQAHYMKKVPVSPKFLAETKALAEARRVTRETKRKREE